MILITNLYSYDFIMGYDNNGLNPGLRNHRIGWENSQESPQNLMVKTHGFPVKIFPTKPIH